MDRWLWIKELNQDGSIAEFPLKFQTSDESVKEWAKMIKYPKRCGSGYQPPKKIEIFEMDYQVKDKICEV